jgi:hypothetical protein
MQNKGHKRHKGDKASRIHAAECRIYATQTRYIQYAGYRPPEYRTQNTCNINWIQRAGYRVLKTERIIKYTLYKLHKLEAVCRI